MALVVAVLVVAVVRTGGFLGTRRLSSQVAITLTERLNLEEVFLVQNFKNVKWFTFYDQYLK